MDFNPNQETADPEPKTPSGGNGGGGGNPGGAGGITDIEALGSRLKISHDGKHHASVVLPFLIQELGNYDTKRQGKCFA